MKKQVYLAVAALVCGMTFTACSSNDNPTPKPEQHYAVLTFEDSDWKAGTNYVGQSSWSSLIDAAQYGGELLYPADPDEATIYQWDDKGNTYLAHEFTNGYMDKAYWGGGHAVSNYIEQDYSTASYTKQLAIPVASGHNGSKNFCVHNGYASYPGAPLPTLYFSDNKARVIDHMYVVNTSYALNDMTNAYTTFKLGEDWFKIIATGYDGNGAVTGTAEFFLAKDGQFVTDWTKFDLVSLGKVVKVEFNVDGSCQNAWGLSTPAYFAYDDVKVLLD
jgi:hypothetical protein